MRHTEFFTVIGILVAGLFLGCGQPSPRPEAAGLSVEDVSAAEIQDKVRQAAGNITIVHFWATWCPPCVHEFPELVRLQRNYEDSGLNILFLSADRETDREAVREFLVGQGVARPTYRVRNLNDEFIQAISTNWSGAIPASFFYDADGTLIEWWEGARSFSDYEAALQPLL